MKTPAKKDWIWLTASLTAALAWGDRAAAATRLDFDLPVASAESGVPTVPSADGLSFRLPPAPPEPVQPDAVETALRLPVPDAPPPVSTTVAAQPVPPAPGRGSRASFEDSLAPDAPDAANLDALFAGDSHSLVARAVGSAEGTRTATGQVTAAYYGHRDPGNQAWNVGTFSYQHGADSPEVADARQLARLRQQAQRLKAQAAAKSMALSQVEILNGIDLANQAPVTALEWGYIDRLHQAKTMGLEDSDAILWARTRAFLDPDSGRWNAPGLGNTVQGISRDQARRMGAIAQVLTQAPASTPPQPSTAPTVDQIADIVINLDLDR